jgi:hypothetical protein
MSPTSGALESRRMSVIFRATGRDLLIWNRVKPIIFGQYAWAEETTEVQEAGSGIFVAPRLGLSAKHVSKSYWKLDSRFEGLQRRRTLFDAQYGKEKMLSEFAALVYSPMWSAQFGDEPVHWGVKTDWASYDTDITTIVVEPRTANAARIEAELRYLDWQLLPPKVGKWVRVFGLPEQEHRIEDNEHQTEAYVWIQPAKIIEHVYPILGHGMFEFPGFLLDRELGHGASGGAVLYDDRLVGIFCGPTMVASLWPLAIHNYLDVDGDERPLAGLLDNDTIHGVDWDEVRGRVQRKTCEDALAGSVVESRCEKQHVVLRGKA